MNAASTSIEQKATITAVNGNVQLIRDGFFLPAQPGMSLLPGDRIVSDSNAKAVIQFTGVKDALVIEKGAAATFNLEVVEIDQVPQWIATDLYGEGVYFDSQAARVAGSEADSPNLFGLFGTSQNQGDSDSTGYPVLESLVFLGATAAIYSDNEDNPDSTETTTSETGTNGGTTPDSSTPPQPSNPEPEPEAPAGPLDGLLEPVTGALDGLLGATGTASPLGALQANESASSPITNLIGSITAAS